MKRKQSGFSFRGFVALADMIFAVSAGLLLLNPIQFEPPPAILPKPKPVFKPPPQEIFLQMHQIEHRLEKLEADGPILQGRTVEVLRNE
jgi:hypothetical protein